MHELSNAQVAQIPRHSDLQLQCLQTLDNQHSIQIIK